MMENLLFIGAGGKGLSLERAVPFSHLANEELVLPSRRHGLRAIMEECASKAGIELHGSVEADSFGAMINLVRSGFGSTALPLAPIYPLVDSGVLCAAPLVDPTPTRKLVLAFPADRPVNPATRFVAETFTLRVPTKPAMHSNLKPAGYSDRKPATLGVNRMGRFDDVVEG
jgi:LysR family nitrogen assimilation transcriptional regulator